jgi:hypothetical protein
VKRIVLLSAATAIAAACASTIAANGFAQGASSLPTITIAMDKTSIAVGGALQSGAVDIRSTTTNEASGSPTVVRLNPGATPDQLFALLGSPAGRDPNNALRVGTIVFDADAPKGTSDVQTTLEPGEYVAFDAAGDNPAKFPRTTFTIAPAAQPAVLPAAQATVRAIDFGFRGPATLHRGDLVRFRNDGFVTHMIAGIRVKDAQAARRVTALLRAGKDSAAQRLAAGFVGFQGPVSPGAVQQEVVAAKPGTYVLACFMDSQDGREHTQLGMLRTIRVVR